MKKTFLFLALGSLAVFAADLLTKFFFVRVLTERVEFSSLAVFELHKNTGIAFSLPLPRELTIVASIVIIAGLLWLFQKEVQKNTLSIVAFSLLLGGAAGNLVERVVLGSVTDFVSLFGMPFFNLADVGIIAGVAVLILFHSRIFRVQ